MNAKDEIIARLEDLIKKYFRIRMTGGLLASFAILALAFLGLSLMNAFAIFPQWFRMTMFWSFLAGSVMVFSYYVLLPAFHYHDIGKRLSLKDAAAMVGIKFGPQPYDYLLSYLQLLENSSWTGSHDLRTAGLIQKRSKLLGVPIPSAVEWNSLLPAVKKYAPLMLIPLLIFLIWPETIKTGSKRWIQYEKPAHELFPFRIRPLPSSLLALASTQHSILVKAEGTAIPKELIINLNGNEFKMSRLDEYTFFYLIPNIENNVPFSLKAGAYQSEKFEVQVVKKPFWEFFIAEVSYPDYLKKEKEIFNSQGDLRLPQGSIVQWKLKPKFSSKAGMMLNDSVIALNPEGLNNVSWKCMKSFSYKLFLDNNRPDRFNADSFSFFIQVIPDQYPEIQAEFSLPDSNMPHLVRFKGNIRDDYGFSSFRINGTLHYTDSSGKSVKQNTLIPLPFDRINTFQNFGLEFDFSNILYRPGSRFEYVLEITDNDGVNGPKTTRSSPFVVKKPGLEELKELQQNTQSNIKSELEESLNKTKELQKNIQDLIKKIQNKKTPEYEDLAKLKELQKMQQELKENIEQLKQLQQKNTEYQKEISPEESRILEKQMELQKLFDEMLNPEIKKLLEELQKLQNEFLQKHELMQKLDEMKMSAKELEKELDRNLELFKQLEWQQKMWENIDKLEELKNKEAELKIKLDQLDKKDKNSIRELAKEQEAINKEWEKLKESIEENERKNQQLEEPYPTPDLKEDMEKISQSLKESQEALEKNNKQNAGKSQENAQKQMQGMLDKMNQSMNEMEQQQEEENIQTLRQILDNLMHVSFEQEKMITELPKTKTESPKYTQIMRNQRRLKEDMKIIEDSLTSLSKRSPQISNLVNKELSNINYQMEKAQKGLVDRITGEALIRMQGALTSVNNLALLLHESMEQMIQQMKSNMQSNCSGGKCKKPKGGNGKSNAQSGSSQIPNLRKLQEQLNKRIEDMKKELEKGNKPGGQKEGEEHGNKPGNKGKSGILGLPGNSAEFAKMAAEQELIRRQLMQIMDKLKNKGQQPGGNLSELMEQTEKELLNKQINPETIRRQQEILTRLLESEKAEREREQDEKRESREGKDVKNGTLPPFLQYKRIMEQEKMNYFTLPPDFTPYYKTKTFEYLNGIKP
ncbi:MAG: hypothetical protein N3F09_06120 [Bacteroidia bacterium]|nr:hypothetical protein [Bacteroidia bacterium]